MARRRAQAANTVATRPQLTAHQLLVVSLMASTAVRVIAVA
ncbi:hypothetical protein [Streptomyces parvus]